jgi:hypothetical protein
MLGCHKPQTSYTIGAAETTIKTTALASIAAKYPNIGSSELAFGQITIKKMMDGKEVIFVTYEIPTSATTTREGRKATTNTKTVNVRMSTSGMVDMVYQGTNQVTYNVDK